MKVVGIIAEYNPFHRGHEYQIRYVRETLGADYVIVAMSGDFVQRGAPALMEKYLRAEMALLGGADLVLELPIQVSTASAEGFAAGGVSLLDGLGCVDELCFGSECGDTEILMETARILVAEPPVYRDFLQKNLRDGMSFPLARSRALTSYVAKSAISDVSSGDGHFIFPEQMDSILSSPNNILGIEYCKAHAAPEQLHPSPCASPKRKWVSRCGSLGCFRRFFPVCFRYPGTSFRQKGRHGFFPFYSGCGISGFFLCA